MLYLLQEEQGKEKRSKEADGKANLTPSGKQNNSRESLPQGSQQRLQEQKKPKQTLNQWIMQQQPQQQQQQQQRAGGQGATAVAPDAAVDRPAPEQAPHQMEIVEGGFENHSLLQLAPPSVQGNERTKAHIVPATSWLIRPRIAISVSGRNIKQHRQRKRQLYDIRTHVHSTT